MRAKSLLLAGLGVCLSLSAWADPHWQSMTDAPRNTDGQTYNSFHSVDEKFEGGRVLVAIPNDGWYVNSAGAMGADREYINDGLAARLGVWVGGSLDNKDPKAIISEFTNNIKQVAGGDWSPPMEKSLGGTPVVEATGTDGYGNYYFRIISFKRFGVPYTLAIRTTYEKRWDRRLAEDLAYIVTESHPTSKAVREMMQSQRRHY